MLNKKHPCNTLSRLTIPGPAQDFGLANEKSDRLSVAISLVTAIEEDDAQKELTSIFQPTFQLLNSKQEDHQTPFNTIQNFKFVHLKKHGK